MATKLRLGISEDRNFIYPRIPADAFKPDGRYRSALNELDRLIDAKSNLPIYAKYWDRSLKSGGTLPATTMEEAAVRLKSDMRWILIYEAEHARIWKEGPLDYMSALRGYKRSAKEVLSVLREHFPICVASTKNMPTSFVTHWIELSKIFFLTKSSDGLKYPTRIHRTGTNGAPSVAPRSGSMSFNIFPEYHFFGLMNCWKLGRVRSTALFTIGLLIGWSSER